MHSPMWLFLQEHGEMTGWSERAQSWKPAVLAKLQDQDKKHAWVFFEKSVNRLKGRIKSLWNTGCSGFAENFLVSLFSQAACSWWIIHIVLLRRMLCSWETRSLQEWSKGKGFVDEGCRISEMFCSQALEQPKVSHHILLDLGRAEITFGFPEVGVFLLHFAQ